MDLVEFLRARLDEDEQVAGSATSGPWAVRPETRAAHSSLYGEADVDGPDGRAVANDRDGGCASTEDAEHIARHDPARVLAEVEAKRRIIEEQTNAGGCQGHPRPWQPHADYRDYGDGYCRDYDGNWTLRWLALPYADHADYQPEWKP